MNDYVLLDFAPDGQSVSCTIHKFVIWTRSLKMCSEIHENDLNHFISTVYQFFL